MKMHHYHLSSSINDCLIIWRSQSISRGCMRKIKGLLEIMLSASSHWRLVFQSRVHSHMGQMTECAPRPWLSLCKSSIWFQSGFSGRVYFTWHTDDNRGISHWGILECPSFHTGATSTTFNPVFHLWCPLSIHSKMRVMCM